MTPAKMCSPLYGVGLRGVASSPREAIRERNSLVDKSSGFEFSGIGNPLLR